MQYFVVTLDSKLHFHCYVDFVYFLALRSLWLICYITCNFSLDSVIVLRNALTGSELVYESVV